MSRQLVTILDDVEIWDFFSPIDQELKLIRAEKLPFIRYPNRAPCNEANLFMQSKFRNGASVKIDGGTLKTYAYNISHLIRFCYNNNKMKLTELTDSFFSLFIKGLIGERDSSYKLKRKANQVIKIGCQCIDFLFFIQGLYSLNSLIGKERFNAIQVIEREHNIIIGKNKVKRINYYRHFSFPTENSGEQRHPISEKAAADLKKVILSHSDIGLRKRNSCIYQTLEQTGARRSEVLMLEVQSIKDALNSDDKCPLLKFDSLKRRDDKKTRYVPVPRIFLENIHQYIRTTRKKIMKNYKKSGNDHGYVFVSHTNGSQLKSNTLSSYMSKWREDGGIEEQVFAHLFRHAYITEKLKCLILEHDFNNKDSFRRALLNTERFKIQLKEWTGHTHLQSLDIYIDLAFSDLAGVKKTYNSVTLKSAVLLMKEKIEEIDSHLPCKNIKLEEIINDFKISLKAFNDDIERSLE